MGLFLYLKSMNSQKVAILVDGGFYRKRASSLFGPKSPTERVDELFSYCLKHLVSKSEKGNPRELYRIFYYDCEPLSGCLYNPISQKNIILDKTEVYKWTCDFLNALKQKRKVALRLGRLAMHSPYILIYQKLKELGNGKLKWEDIQPEDLTVNLEQKGVDMRIGVDISSLAFKRQVDRIILISGDSDFVPAAKQARREGIDFILDPMGSHIEDELFEHIDGLQSRISWLMKKAKLPSKSQL